MVSDLSVPVILVPLEPVLLLQDRYDCQMGFVISQSWLIFGGYSAVPEVHNDAIQPFFDNVQELRERRV